MNRVCFTGTVTSIGHLDKGKTGQDAIKFVMEVKTKDRTDSPAINAYGETAREISNKLKKGNLIYFEGEYRTGKYGAYITPVKIERMLGNKSEPENIVLAEDKKSESVFDD